MPVNPDIQAEDYLSILKFNLKIEGSDAQKTRLEAGDP
jgi:hypothetical protein